MIRKELLQAPAVSSTAFRQLCLRLCLPPVFGMNVCPKSHLLSAPFSFVINVSPAGSFHQQVNVLFFPTVKKRPSF